MVGSGDGEMSIFVQLSFHIHIHSKAFATHGNTSSVLKTSVKEIATIIICRAKTALDVDSAI